MLGKHSFIGLGLVIVEVENSKPKRKIEEDLDSKFRQLSIYRTVFRSVIGGLESVDDSGRLKRSILFRRYCLSIISDIKSLLLSIGIFLVKNVLYVSMIPIHYFKDTLSECPIE